MTTDIDKLVERAKAIMGQRETISHDAYGAQKAVAMIEDRDALIEALAKKLDEARDFASEFLAAAKDGSISKSPAFKSDDLQWLADRARRLLEGK